ncbi:MAG TPA: metallophosphoesterase [Bryobacteraceae bacterium]|nr:metallophosphoesterase [Bryobacteraceae bacterium]
MLICTEYRIQRIGSEWRDHLYYIDSERISIAQLSDVHWDLQGSVADTTRKRNELLGTLDQLKVKTAAEAIHGIIFSGDLACGPSAVRLAKRDNDSVDAIFRKIYRDARDVILAALKHLDIDAEKGCLAIPGNHDVVRDSTEAKKHEPFLETIIKPFSKDPPPHADEAIECPRLCLIGNDHGVIAIIGLDSNHAQYKDQKELHTHGLVGPEQIARTKSLIETLQNAVSHCPLYVCVTIHHHLLPVSAPNKKSALDDQEFLRRVTLDARAVIEALQDSFVSLVVHGHMHDEAIQQVSYLPPRPDRSKPLLSIVSSPQYDKGAVLLTFDLYTGQVAVQIAARDADKKFIGTALPLVSASRIPPREMRLYREIKAWLDPSLPALPSGRNRDVLPPVVPGLRDAYWKALEEEWKECGYVRITSTEKVPLPISPEADLPSKKYHLLLCLRHENGTEEILLNNHVPLRTSEISAWDTLLLPAFTELRQEFEHARRDLLRSAERVLLEDIDELSNRTALRDSLRQAVANLTIQNWEEMESNFRVLAQREFVKFSPTDGFPQRYEYTIVTLDDLARKSGGALADAIRNVKTMMRERGEACLRPDTGPARTQAQAIGLHWFSLERWGDWSSIRARNGDVMEWVESVIADIKSRERGRPTWLYYGELDETPNQTAIVVVKRHPFRASAGRARLDNGFPNSLETGLRRVQFNRDGLLRGQLAYPEAKIETVQIRRVGDRISVFDTSNNPLGFLRPTQRYSLHRGLRRVEWLHDQFRKLRPKIELNDLDGYLRVTVHGGAPMAMLPPVIEPVAPKERERDGEPDYLVCDGTHRIVQHCWVSGRTLSAVLVPDPVQPYYAYPFPSRDWSITAENVLDVPPQMYGKHTPRKFPGDNSKHGYRSYFRDFNTGFVNIGGQGGRAI